MILPDPVNLHCNVKFSVWTLEQNILQNRWNYFIIKHKKITFFLHRNYFTLLCHITELKTAYRQNNKCQNLANAKGLPYFLFLPFITIEYPSKHSISDLSVYGTMLCRHVKGYKNEKNTACPHGAYSLHPQIN